MLINGKIRNHWGPPSPWTFIDKTDDGKSNEWCKCDVVTGECSCFVVYHQQQLHSHTLIRVLSYLLRYIINPKRVICSLCSTFHYIGYNDQISQNKLNLWKSFFAQSVMSSTWVKFLIREGSHGQKFTLILLDQRYKSEKVLYVNWILCNWRYQRWPPLARLRQKGLRGKFAWKKSLRSQWKLPLIDFDLKRNKKVILWIFLESRCVSQNSIDDYIVFISLLSDWNNLLRKGLIEMKLTQATVKPAEQFSSIFTFLSASTFYSFLCVTLY